LVLVDIAEPKRDVERFLAQKGFDFEILLDREGEAAEEYRISGVPSFVFVAADGKVRDVLHELPGDYLEILK
ncbi:MAG: redoxin domain-containing protein, partial [Elusimicrobia bacterium]|nr:redoxin domain-containing protein [Elusimicrobiota bacterium]